MAKATSEPGRTWLDPAGIVQLDPAAQSEGVLSTHTVKLHSAELHIAEVHAAELHSAIRACCFVVSTDRNIGAVQCPPW